MMRITRNGAARAWQKRQTPSVSSALTEPWSRALVRRSEAAGLATSVVSIPADASAIAAVRPAGPPPTITTSAVRLLMSQVSSQIHRPLGAYPHVERERADNAYQGPMIAP